VRAVASAGTVAQQPCHSVLVLLYAQCPEMQLASARCASFSLAFQHAQCPAATVCVAGTHACLPIAALLSPLRPLPRRYGPFWICTTLIFVTCVAGNLAGYIQWQQAQAGLSPTPSGSEPAPGSSVRAGSCVLAAGCWRALKQAVHCGSRQGWAPCHQHLLLTAHCPLPTLVLSACLCDPV